MGAAGTRCIFHTNSSQSKDNTHRHETDRHSRSPAPKAPLSPPAAAAPLGHAAGSRLRGADSLAQALDLLANHRGISHDRRLGDHARVMQVEVARAAARPYWVRSRACLPVARRANKPACARPARAMPPVASTMKQTTCELCARPEYWPGRASTKPRSHHVEADNARFKHTSQG